MDNDTLLQYLKNEAAHIDAAMRDDLASIENPLLAKVINHAVFQGGKRVRPLLVVFSARLLEAPSKAINELAIPFEYLHAASLLHDDVIDHAEMRRGKKTANTLWGANAVILAGDYLHARAMLLAGGRGGAESLGLISRAIGAMVEAEFLQMQTVAEQKPSEANYFTVLRGKTAALIAAACEVGILHAGGNPGQCLALRTYGANLGLAFQIIDDLLDYQGDPGNTGKTVGNDFQEGKMTLPLLAALDHATGPDHAFLEQLLRETPEARCDAFPAARQLIDRHGGFATARKKAEQLVDDAIRQLDPFPDSDAKNALQGLAHYVLNRKE